MMATRLRLAGLLVAISAAAIGCVGGPEEAVASHQEDLALGLPGQELPVSEQEAKSIAGEVWLEGDDCADAGQAAKSTGHEVRWTVKGGLLFVEIDGVLACAGDADEMDAGQRELYRYGRGTSPDEGGPEPEPAGPDTSGPEPEPANPDHGGCSGQNAAPSSGGEEAQSGEGQGGPEPEPAFGGNGDGGSFAAAGDGASASGAR